MKRLDILYGVPFVMTIALLIIGFTVPQAVLDDNEIYFLWIILSIMAFLWFRAFLDAKSGN